MSTNYIDQITDTAGTTHDISEGDSTRIFRATCSTGATTAAKVATLQTSDRNFSLTTGVRVAVTFSSGNSATTNLTLNVNSTGAKNIYYRTAISTAQAVNELCVWGANETVIFTYNGSSWLMMGSSLALYNAYNKAASSGSGTITGITTTAGTHSTINVSSGTASFNVPTKTSHLTNDSGFITSDSDEKVKAEIITDTSNYQLLLMNSLGGFPRTDVGYESNEYSVNSDNTDFSRLNIGYFYRGQIGFGYKSGSTIYRTTLTTSHTTTNRTITLPDKTGTVALTSDIPTLSMSASNGTLTITHS